MKITPVLCTLLALGVAAPSLTACKSKTRTSRVSREEKAKAAAAREAAKKERLAKSPWPALTLLDDWSEDADVAVKKKSDKEAAKVAAKAAAAARGVLKDPIPEKVSNKEQLKPLLAELDALAKELGQPKAPMGDVYPRLARLHPLVGKIIETAQIPHVHADDAGGPPKGS